MGTEFLAVNFVLKTEQNKVKKTQQNTFQSA